MVKYQQGYINNELLPVVWEITHGNDIDLTAICKWLELHKESINNVLDTQGALLLRGFKQLCTAADFNKVINTISPSLMGYIGGTSPRTVVQDKIMTATEIPANWSIPLHQEMSYTSNPPDKIAFFCETPAEKGGYSTIGDMRKVTEKISPLVMKKFQQHGLQLRRALPSSQSIQKKAGIKKTWNEVFATNDKTKVNEIASSKGWKTKWLDSDNLQLWQEILPAYKLHPHLKEKIWFNQVHMFTPFSLLSWANRDKRINDYEEIYQANAENPDLLDSILYGNGEKISEHEIDYITQLLLAAEINVKLEKSDVLILDNILVAHGRTQFIGKRQIYVALMNN